jgi:hypothetical protein
MQFLFFIFLEYNDNIIYKIIIHEQKTNEQ